MIVDFTTHHVWGLCFQTWPSSEFLWRDCGSSSMGPAISLSDSVCLCWILNKVPSGAEVAGLENTFEYHYITDNGFQWCNEIERNNYLILWKYFLSMLFACTVLYLVLFRPFDSKYIISGYIVYCDCNITYKMKTKLLRLPSSGGH